MEGNTIMPRSAKGRTHERKRKRKEMSAAKTDKSRTKRLANKAKRDEIHAIDPDMKIVVINQRTYDKYGIEIQVIDGKITNVLELAVPEIFEPEIVEAADEGEVNVMQSNGDIGKEIDIQIEKERLGIFSKLAGKFRKK